MEDNTNTHAPLEPQRPAIVSVGEFLALVGTPDPKRLARLRAEYERRQREQVERMKDVA